MMAVWFYLLFGRWNPRLSFRFRYLELYVCFSLHIVIYTLVVDVVGVVVR